MSLRRRGLMPCRAAEGTFPAQIRISINGAGWRESDINQWIADPVRWRPLAEFDFNDQSAS